jgi:excinuclease UvrABC nuclease subunit
VAVAARFRGRWEHRADTVPIVGVVKDERHKPVRLIGDKRVIEAFEKDILLANREAHRFAINWHRRRRGKIY